MLLFSHLFPILRGLYSAMFEQNTTENPILTSNYGPYRIAWSGFVVNVNGSQKHPFSARLRLTCYPLMRYSERRVNKSDAAGNIGVIRRALLQRCTTDSAQVRVDNTRQHYVLFAVTSRYTWSDKV
ncbi:MAG TPA: hypothetical protein DHW02_16930 [Ktedonobacter sp.]|nr:hypothetical protein [Ktedonobacter sp.]